jgi:hypothetical protein
MPTLFTIPIRRYMKTYGPTHEQLAMVSVTQREWAARNPRVTFKTPITVDDVLNSRMIVYPFRLLQLLPGDQWRRRANPVRGRARPGLPAKACPWPDQGPVYLAEGGVCRRQWSPLTSFLRKAGIQGPDLAVALGPPPSRG